MFQISKNMFIILAKPKKEPLNPKNSITRRIFLTSGRKKAIQKKGKQFEYLTYLNMTHTWESGER